MTSPAPLESRLDELFAAIDRMDADAFNAFLTDDALFRFGSGDPVHGHAAIKEAVNGFWASIAGSRHDIQTVIRQGDTLACEGLITYTRHDGSELTVPFADVFAISGELISEYKIYADITALYSG